LVSLAPGILHPEASGSIRLDDEDHETVSDYAEDGPATEDTQLLGGVRKPSPVALIRDGVTGNILLLAPVIGLLIGLIKPAQRVLVGDVEHFTGGWQSLGGGLVILGGAFAAVDMLAVGSTIRAGEKK
jgi:hypothetical protein